MGEVVQEGMSLRDYAAIHAPAAEIEEICPNTVGDCAALLGLTSLEYVDQKAYPRLLGLLRYRYADAMLAARGDQP